MKPISAVVFASLLLCATVHAQSISMETVIVDTNNLAATPGWTSVAEWTMNQQPTIDLDADGIVDWMVPRGPDPDNWRVDPAPYSEKAGVNMLLFWGWTAPRGFKGANTSDDPQIYWAWTGGDPVATSPAGGWYATCFVGTSAYAGTMEWRVLVNDGTYQIHHFWNHGYLDYQLVEVKLFDANDNLLAEAVPYEFSGTLGQFSSTISVTGSAPGDYVSIAHLGSNVGWRGTYVTADGGTPGPIGWQAFDDLSWVYLFTQEWGDSPTFGWIYLGVYPFIYTESHGWLYSFGESISASATLYSFDLMDYVVVQDALVN